MTWTVEYDEALGVVVDTYIGRSTGQDFNDVATKRIALGKEKGSTKTLIDTSRMEADSSTTFDVFHIVENMYREEGSRAHWRMAILTPESAAARTQVNFFVTVCKNRGWIIEEFAQRKEAIDWLLKQSPAS